MNVAMGVYDNPQDQKQPIFFIDHFKRNVAIFGGPMTGKTTFVKTFLVRMHDNPDMCPKEDVYIIDFGNNLGEYGQLKNVCACFGSSSEEDIKRIFRTIETRMEANAKQLGSSSYYTLVDTEPQKCPNHITLIIENLNAFLTDERYSNYQDRLLGFCRDGLAKGLSVILTANDLSGTSRIVSNCGQKIAFEMPADSYMEVFGCKVAMPMSAKGRGVATVIDDSGRSGIYEFQCFLPFENETKGLRLLNKKYENVVNPNLMSSFSEELTEANFNQFCKGDLSVLSDKNNLCVGLDYYEHFPMCVNIKESPSIAIYGKRKFGKTNLLFKMLRDIKTKNAGVRIIYLDDGRQQLTGFYDEDQKSGIDSLYFKDVTSLRSYLVSNGYGGIPRDSAGGIDRNASSASESNTPFTVFVLQGKMLFQGSVDAKYLMAQLFPEMIGNAEAKQYLFIYSDVRNIADADIRTVFNNSISVAFLLDNIGEFVGDKGSKSVFGEMDAKELKAEYAKCSIGDGYCYDIETDSLKKVKFIKNIK